MTIARPSPPRSSFRRSSRGDREDEGARRRADRAASAAGLLRPREAAPEGDRARAARRRGSSSPGPRSPWSSPLLASLLLPVRGHPAPVAFAGDMILFVYLFALSRFFTAAAALDTGSAFEGMGAARELDVRLPRRAGALLRPPRARADLRLALALADARSEPGRGRARRARSCSSSRAGSIVLLAENWRVPFDDPNTHLELTMIHEVMVLDHGGPAFGAGPLRGRGEALRLQRSVAHVVLPPFGSTPRSTAGATLARDAPRSASRSASSRASWRACDSSTCRSFSSRRASSRHSPSSWS